MQTFETIATATGIPVEEILDRFDLKDYDPKAELRDDIADGIRDALTNTNPEAQEPTP